MDKRIATLIGKNCPDTGQLARIRQNNGLRLDDLPDRNLWATDHD